MTPVYVVELMCPKEEWFAHNVKRKPMKGMVKMKEAPKYTVWTDYYLDLEDWRESLEEEYPGYSDDELTDIMYKTNSAYIYDERANLNIQFSKPIIVIGDLGRWNGRVTGYKDIDSGNIQDCLYSDRDYNTWYVDEQGDLRCEAIHHDGTDYYRYRVFKPTATEEQMEDLRDKIYYGRATEEDITSVTDRLGDVVGRIYGWTFPTEVQKSNMEVNVR